MSPQYLVPSRSGRVLCTLCNREFYSFPSQVSRHLSSTRHLPKQPIQDNDAYPHDEIAPHHEPEDDEEDHEEEEFNDNMEAWFEEETPTLEGEPVQEELFDDQEILQNAFHGDDEDRVGIESLRVTGLIPNPLPFTPTVQQKQRA